MSSPVPVLAAEVMARLQWWLLPQEPGDPRRIVGTATIVDGEAVLLTDAIVGPQGIPGEPADVIRRNYDVTEVGDLPDADTLDESDWGRGWYIDGQWHVFDHGTWHVLQGSLPGPPGTTPLITASAEQIEAPDSGPIGEIEVDQSGTSTEPHFHFKVPGIPGPDGPAAAIEAATDYDDDGTPAEEGDFLVKKAVGWGPGTPTLLVPKKYTIPHNNFIAHTGSEPRFLIASQNIDPQETDWYPDVLGRVKWWKQNILSSVQMEVEVRIGVTGASTGENEPLCGLAAYDPGIAILDTAVLTYILPQFSTVDDPDRAVAPDAGVGVCNAGDPYTVYVFMHKIGGSGNYSVTNDRTAQLRINVEPVAS